MSEIRFTEIYPEEKIPPAPAGFQKPSAGAVSVLPEKLKELRRMANSFDYMAQASAKNFYDQGQFAADYEDDYLFRGTVRRYYPTYSALTNNELRGYFGFRTRFRAGKPDADVPSSLVYIYIYELLNGIGVTPEEGLQRLLEIDRLYGVRDLVMRQHLKVWIPDYLVYYNLGPELAPGYVDLAGDRNRECLASFLKSAPARKEGDPVCLPGLFSRDGVSGLLDLQEVFKALQALSAYAVEKSALAQQSPEEAAGLYAYVLYGLEGIYKREQQVYFRELCIGRKDVRTYRMFRSAVFYDHRNYRSYEYDISPVQIFRCTDGLWTLEMYREGPQARKTLGAVCREIDRQARLQLHIGRPLKEGNVSRVMEELTAGLVRQYLMEKADAERTAEREAALSRVRIDMSLLEGIREDAAVTRDSLIVEETESADLPARKETESADDVPASPSPGVTVMAVPDSMAEQEVSAGLELPGESEDSAGSELSAEPECPESTPGEDSLLTEEERYFLHALLYGGAWREYLKERHLPLTMLADGINEKLMDVIGDTVIEFAGDVPELIEDYREELTELVPE